MKTVTRRRWRYLYHVTADTEPDVMPVTPTFSEDFYKKLGHGIADEFVNWFNQVHTAFRTDLKDLNELNYARFESFGWRAPRNEGILSARNASIARTRNLSDIIPARGLAV
ncbi:MAG: hypothetical protein P8X82_05235 [Gemmatimonadales bacterium]